MTSHNKARNAHLGCPLNQDYRVIKCFQNFHVLDILRLYDFMHNEHVRTSGLPAPFFK